MLRRDRKDLRNPLRKRDCEDIRKALLMHRTLATRTNHLGERTFVPADFTEEPRDHRNFWDTHPSMHAAAVTGIWIAIVVVPMVALWASVKLV
jgi:hypothetical protein